MCPDASGATNWASPSWDPQTKLFYRGRARILRRLYEPDEGAAPRRSLYVGSGQKEEPEPVSREPSAPSIRRPATSSGISICTRAPGRRGVLATAGGVVFASSKDGNLIALDSRTGSGTLALPDRSGNSGSPISYSVDGKQYIAVSTDSALFTFALH